MIDVILNILSWILLCGGGAFVLIGGICHFLAVIWYVLPVESAIGAT